MILLVVARPAAPVDAVAAGSRARSWAGVTSTQVSCMRGPSSNKGARGRTCAPPPLRLPEPPRALLGDASTSRDGAAAAAAWGCCCCMLVGAGTASAPKPRSAKRAGLLDSRGDALRVFVAPL